MERRELLGALAAGVVGLSGCLSNDDPNGADGDGTPTPTDPPTASGTPTGSPTPTESQTPTEPTDGSDGNGGTPDPSERPPGSGTVVGEFVRELFVVPELVAPDSPDSFGVYGGPGDQYVVALVDAGEGTPPTLDEITLTAGGEPYEATTEVGYGAYALFDYGGAYDPVDERRGWIVVELSKPLDVESATLAWPGGEYALDADALDRLARPPTSFEVQSFETPETASPGETVTATVTVENTGDADGTFVGALNRTGALYVPLAGIRLDVPAGETATWEYEHEIRDESYDEDYPITFSLYWRDGDLSRDVTVQVPSTTDATDAADATKTSDATTTGP